MKAYGYLFVVLVLSTAAVNSGFAAQGQAAKGRGGASASGNAAGQGPAGGVSSVSGTVGGQGRGGDKGTSIINETGMGAQH
jgi:hypothetical protein